MQLDLSNNDLGLLGGNALASALCKNHTLTTLVLSNNNFGPNVGKALANALCKNDTLTSLNLSNTNLGSCGGKAIANALFQNDSLIYLNLLCNQLGSDVGKALANALCKNNTLATLTIYLNQLELEGVIADALRKNYILTSLELSYNFLGNDAAKALVNSLHVNTTLTSLQFKGNQFTLEVEDVLKKIMQKRGSFLDTRLDPGDDNIEELYSYSYMDFIN